MKYEIMYKEYSNISKLISGKSIQEICTIILNSLHQDVKENLNAKSPFFYAVVALISFDCAYMLDSSIDEIKLLSKLGSPSAMLLEASIIILRNIESSKEIL